MKPEKLARVSLFWQILKYCFAVLLFQIFKKKNKVIGENFDI